MKRWYDNWDAITPIFKLEDFQFAFHILCIGSDKIGHDFRNFLKLFFEVKKDIKKDARISPDTVVTNTPKFHSRNHFFLSFFGIIIQVFATISIYFKDGFSA